MKSKSLQKNISEIKGVGPKVKEEFNKIGVNYVQDALFLLPKKYENRTKLTSIKDLTPGEAFQFEGEILKDELTKGVNNFEVETEQYYMHIDPNIDIIAQSRFTSDPYPWIENVVMPVAWKKKYGNGKVFYISLGHDPEEFLSYNEAWTLLTRGIIWALR